MPPLLRSAFLWTALAAAAPAAFAGTDVWTPLGPYGGNVQALAADPDQPGTLYAGTDTTGVWKSRDGGRHWFAARDGLGREPWSIHALAVAPGAGETVYAGTEAGLFKTADGGSTWVPMALRMPSELAVLSLAVNPADPEEVWAGNGKEIWRTKDGGRSWSPFFAEAGWISIDPNDPSTLLAFGTGPYDVRTLFRKEAGGRWRSLYSSNYTFVSAVAVDPENPRTLYLALESVILKSTNAGATWHLLAGLDEGFLSFLVFDPSDPQVLLAGGSGLHRSTDRGKTWKRVEGLPGPSGYSFLIADSTTPGRLWLGMETWGVFASLDGGRTWRPAQRGIASSQAVSVAFDPFRRRTLYAGVEKTGFHRSADAGLTWTRANAGLDRGRNYFLSPVALAAHPSRPGTLYAASAPGVFETTDRGAHWRLLDAPWLYEYATVAIDPWQPSTLFAGGQRLFRSRDGGSTWKPLQLDPACVGHDTDAGEVIPDPVQPGRVFLRTVDSRHGDSEDVAQRSLDGGDTWECLYLAASAVALDPRSPGLVYAVAGGDFWRSRDGGTAWEVLAEGVFSYGQVTGLVVDGLDPSIFYVSLTDFERRDRPGILRSQDGGATWAPLDAGLITSQIHCLKADPRAPRHLVACTLGNGLVEIRLSPTERELQAGPGADDRD